MAKSNRPNKREIKQAPAFDWKNHPVVIAAGSAAAAVLLCLAIFSQLVLPTQTAKLEIELLKLKDANKVLHEANTKLTESNTALSKTLLKSKKSEETLSASLLQARTSRLFSTGNPYPNGIGVIRIGMSPDSVQKNYPPESIDPVLIKDRYITVRFKNSPFVRVNYYFADGKTNNKSITHIAFNMDYQDKYPDNFLQNKLTEAFGAPSDNPRPEFYSWNIGKDLVILKNDKYSYLVMDSKYRPGYWPE